MQWQKRLSPTELVQCSTGTQSFVLIVDDPDASGGGTWVHLNLFNIPSSTTEIPRITATSFVATFPSGTLGKSDWDTGHPTTTWGTGRI